MEITIDFDQQKTIAVQTARRRFAEYSDSLDILTASMQVDLDKWLLIGKQSWEDGLTVSVFCASMRCNQIIQDRLGPLESQELFLAIAGQILAKKQQANTSN